MQGPSPPGAPRPPSATYSAPSGPKLILYGLFRPSATITGSETAAAGPAAIGMVAAALARAAATARRRVRVLMWGPPCGVVRAGTIALAQPAVLTPPGSGAVPRCAHGPQARAGSDPRLRCRQGQGLLRTGRLQRRPRPDRQSGAPVRAA